MNQEQTLLFIEGKARCTTCSEIKSLDEFYKNKKKANGRRSQCKVCSVATGNSYSVNRQKSGWTQKEYDETFIVQQYRCAICNRPKMVDEPAFAGDHDHATGAKRAILCPSCNLMLGHAKDNPEVLRLAAEYIEHHRDVSPTVVLDPPAIQ